MHLDHIAVNQFASQPLLKNCLAFMAAAAHRDLEEEK